MSNIYAALGRWDDATKARKVVKDRGLRKDTGQSWIKVMNNVHAT